MENIVKWLFSILIAKFSFAEGVYSGSRAFCKDRVGLNVQKWNDSTQDSDTVYLIIKLASDELINLNYASKVCKQCHDAQVISLQDAPNMPHSSLPAWINLTARAFKSDNGRNATWDQYANLGNLTIYWAFGLPSPSSIYALLIIPSMRSTGIRYVAFPQDDLYYSGPGIDEARRASIFVARTIICRHPRMKYSCHYWTIESERCIFHPKFGCHKYTDFMSRPPDDAENATVCMGFRRTVKRCPLAKCSCSLTSWSEWSLCDETYCTTEPKNRTRQRRVVEPCPIGWIYEILNQTEPCPLPEDCEILANNFTMNDSFILRSST